MQNHLLFFKMKKIIVFSIAFFLANSLSAAINADSLIAILGLQKDDTNKVNMQLELADYYATKNVEKSVEYAEAALFLSKELKYTKGELHGLMKVGLANNDMGKVSSAISNFEEVIIRAKELGLKKPLASAYNNLGISYFNKADYETALNYYFDFLKVAEEVSDTLLICSGLNNVANVYVKLQKNEKALEYHYKSLSLAV
jgi:tetratricopeptide (TPR) repeat protein